MTIRNLTIIILLTLILVGCSAALADQTDMKVVMDEVDKRYNAFKDMSFTLRMTIEEKDGTKKVREMNIWQKDGKRLIRFTKPAGDRGVAFLSLDAQNSFVYLPAYKKIRRIAAHVRNQTFMGSDLSFEDMSTTYYGKDYTPKLLSENDNFWEIELTIKPGSDAGYPKLVISVNKQRYTIEKIDYYTSATTQLKTEKRWEWKQYNDKYWMPLKMQTTTLETGHSTLTEMTEYKFDTGLDDGLFSQRSLKRPVR